MVASVLALQTKTDVTMTKNWDVIVLSLLLAFLLTSDMTETLPRLIWDGATVVADLIRSWR